MHAAAGVKPLYRGVSTEDLSKAVVIHQVAPGVVKKPMADNKALIASLSGRALKSAPTPQSDQGSGLSLLRRPRSLHR
ncbi:MAG: DUF3764 family protein [Prochlorococcus sp.]